ncbi:MAG: hypothetical protein Kow00127_18750 [Bacteroidales bacterium]
MAESEGFFNGILSDRVSGSVQLLEKMLYRVEELILLPAPPSREKLAHELVNLFFKLPGFAVVYHAVNFFLSLISKNLTNEEVARALRDYRDHWENAQNSIALHTARLATGNGFSRILLHSHSGTLIAGCREIIKTGRQTTFFQTISEPGGEGRLQLETLKSSGASVQLIPDIPDDAIWASIEVVLTGADVLTPDLWINKTGTRLLAESAHQRNIPVVILADSRKWINPEELPARICNKLLDSFFDKEEHPGIRNPLFEATPAGYATAWINETGNFEGVNQFGVPDTWQRPNQEWSRFL